MKKMFQSLLFMAMMIITACTGPVSFSKAPEDEFIPIPTKFKPVIMLKLGFSAPVRLIPEDFDPINQLSVFLKQYQKISAEKSEIWYGGTIQGDHYFSLEVSTLSTDPSEVVRPQLPIHLKVTKTEEPVDEMDIISTTSGIDDTKGFLDFPDLELQEVELDLLPDNPAPLELRADKNPSAVYNFHAVCSSPGIYRLDFTILPYTFVGADGAEIQASSYFIISLACPRSFTSWVWNGEPDSALEKSGSFIFRDGRYVSQP